ncbi:unnamed protein product [Calypogeia fissa]
MLNKQSMFKPRHVAANRDSDGLDFGPALSTQSGTTSAQKDNSITLWGPGVNMQKNPSSILTQSLHDWRKENAQLPAAKAAEELHNMYENLPPEALELTFQDMIRRNNSPKRKSDGGAGKKTTSPTKLRNAINGTFVKDLKDVKDVKDANKQVRDASKEKENVPKVPLYAKISLMLAPKEVYPSSNRTSLTQEDLDRLLERRRRKSASSNITGGLYSASATPPTSFRRVSPIPSPVPSPIPSPKTLSPTPSFHKLMIQVDGHSIERELSKSSRVLETYLQDEGGMPQAVHEESHDLHRQRPLPRTPKRMTRGKDANDCSTCSTTNLFLLKTICRACGKAYCPSCKNVETKEVIGGRRCNDNCGVELFANDGFVKEREEKKCRRRAHWKIGLGRCMRG